MHRMDVSSHYSDVEIYTAPNISLSNSNHLYVSNWSLKILHNPPQ